MNRVELLAPAGDFESLVAAIQNGADAIYLGGNMFNARASAKNFNKDELLEAVHYAHIRGVKIYVTVNILYQDNEFKQLVDYIDYLYDIQVDALIIQDIGLFHVVRQRYSDFEIHMSTQASVMNKYSAKYFENQGAHRVVLARENTIDEIKEIKDYTDIELEVFVHGALCVCYSGQCLMSSKIGHRSGNRGQCAQPCRLKYKLKENNTILKDKPFLISPKDLMTIDHVGELIKTGISSFKIEGRMKRPEYVASVTKAYRQAIDAYYDNISINLESYKKDMAQMFNRDYTSGYLFHDRYILTGDYSGNKGIIIGQVIGYDKRRKLVSIKLNSDLYQEDSVVFEDIDKGRPVNKIYLNHKLVNHASKGDIIEIEFNYFVNKGNVRKTIDYHTIDRLQKSYDKEYHKREIDIEFVGHINDYPKIKVKCDDIVVEKIGNIKLVKAIKKATDTQRISQQLSKLGNTPFKINNIHIDIDNINIAIKDINQLRRESIDGLTHQLENKMIHHSDKQKVNIIPFRYSTNHIDIYVSSISQLMIAIKYDMRYIYYPYQKDSLEALNICNNYHKEMVLFIPRILKSREIDEIKNSKVYSKVNKIVVNEIGAFYAFSDKKMIIGTGLNIYNSYSLNYFKDYESIVSLEITKILNNQLNSSHIVQAYGREENMISEYCPITQHYHHKQIKKCNRCKNKYYSLIDNKNYEFPIIMDEQCRMHLLNSTTKSININEYNNCNYLLFFTIEDSHTINSIIERYLLSINNFLKM